MNYRIGWILVGDILTGSSRIMGYNTHDCLVKKGVLSKILVPKQKSSSEPYFNYNPIVSVDVITGSKWDLMVFQKVRGNAILETINTCKCVGIKTAYCLDDWRPESAEMGKLCDLVIVSADYLRDKMFTGHSNVATVRHGYESPINKYKTNYRHHSNKAVYVYGVKAIPEMLVSAIHSTGWRIVTIGRRKTCTYAWNLNTVYDHILQCDIGIVPAGLSTENDKSKAYNRAILYMALGIPVIASPIPEYYTIIKHGVNGFIAHTPEDWIKYLQLLKDPVLCESMGRQARKDVAGYTTERHSNEYDRLFRALIK